MLSLFSRIHGAVCSSSDSESFKSFGKPTSKKSDNIVLGKQGANAGGESGGSEPVSGDDLTQPLPLNVVFTKKDFENMREEEPELAEEGKP